MWAHPRISSTSRRPTPRCRCVGDVHIEMRCARAASASSRKPPAMPHAAPSSIARKPTDRSLLHCAARLTHSASAWGILQCPQSNRSEEQRVPRRDWLKVDHDLGAYPVGSKECKASGSADIGAAGCRQCDPAYPCGCRHRLPPSRDASLYSMLELERESSSLPRPQPKFI
jgi:hypothetical protein